MFVGLLHIMLSYLACFSASCAVADGVPVFNERRTVLTYEVGLQMEKASSDLAHTGDKVEAKE